jgi:Tfp pilus assembly protein PilO
MAEAPRKAQSGQSAKRGTGNVKLTNQQMQNIAAVVLIVTAFIFAYAKFLFLPGLKAFKEKSAALEQKKKELSDARNMVAKYPEFLSHAHDISAKTEFINRRLPQEANVAGTIREITKSATESNINIINFEPGKESVKGDYREMEIKLKFLATYADLGNFLTKLGYIERLTTSSQLSIKALTDAEIKAGGKSGHENISVEMIAKIYSFL